MTPVLCCGLECGVLGTSLGQHLSTLAGAPSVVTSPARSGARALRCNAAGAAVTVRIDPLTSALVKVARFYIYFQTSLPNGNTYLATPSGVTAGLYFQSSDSKLYARVGASQSASGVTVTTGNWYRIDLRLDNNTGSNYIVDLQVDGTAVEQVSAGAGGSNSLIALGVKDAVTADVLYDDILISETTGDYPIGAGYINHFVPTADGTHNIAGTGDFQRGNTGTDILNATTDAYLLVDDVPLPTGTVDQADCWRAVAPPNVTDYVEGVFGPAPGISTPAVAPRAVDAILAHHQISTTTGMMKVDLNDNGTVNSILNITPAAAGVVTYRYAQKQYAAGPAGAWTIGGGGNGDFTNIRCRFYSADANPDQCLDAIMLEAEFSPGGALTLQVGDDLNAAF